MAIPPAIDPLRGVTEPSERDLFHALRGDAWVLDALDAERWRALTEVALRTSSGPLLYVTLRDHGWLDRLPHEVELRLARLRAWSAARWALSERQVEELGGALLTAGVRSLVLKGAHVGRLYSVPGTRGTADIDLLVKPPDLDAARSVMVALGYTAERAASWGADHRGHRHLAPFHRSGSLPVEVHWTLGAFTESVGWADAVWERAMPWGDPAGALAMEPLDALLYTCKHLALHSTFNTTNGIAGLADVKVLLDAFPQRPDVLAERAGAWGITSSVAITLHLARDLLNASFDPELLDALGVPGVDAVVPSAVWRLMHVAGVGAIREAQLRTRATLNPPHPSSGIGGRRPWRAAWAYGRKAALPPLDDLRLDHPRLGRTRFARLAYPLHWGRLAWRHLGLLRLLDRRRRGAVWATQARHRGIVRRFVGRDA